MMDTAGIETVFREESGRAIASLVRRLGDIDLAEEAVQEAFVEAVRRWPAEGPPPSPAGWIITTARNRAVDRLRRESLRTQRHLEAMTLEDDMPPRTHEIEDDRLRLIFTCCHPALGTAAQVALTLRLIGGLTTPEIARAFLTPETTMAQRLVRAKRKIKAANIPYRVPAAAELSDRLKPVLAVGYLVFNEGFVATTGEQLTRDDLAVEGIRLARLLFDLMPDEPEVMGLLALMLLTHSRRAARVDFEGRLVRLADQDRRLWDRDLIEEGHELVRRCLRRNLPGPYQIQAAISAVHTDAEDAADTDWAQVLALYRQLRAFDPSPVIALNQAVALAEVTGPESGLSQVESLDLEGYHLYHAIRADFLARLGREGEAIDAYERAIALTSNQAELNHLSGMLETIRARPLHPT
ncbi:MAG TPA: RNA polymerase sigma factor [Acidimicrobiia bacterium]